MRGSESNLVKYFAMVFLALLLVMGLSTVVMSADKPTTTSLIVMSSII